MDQVSENYGILGKGSNPSNQTSFSSHSENRRSGEMVKKMNSPLFLSDEELELIKDRIRKKHHTNTTRLLILYGLLLIILLSIFSYFDFLG